MKQAELFQKATGKKLLAWSSIWNIHGIDNMFNVAQNKNSNLHAEISKLFKKGVKSVTLIVSGKGRSQHSETSVAIFEGITNSVEWGEYYMGECSELFSHNFEH